MRRSVMSVMNIMLDIRLHISHKGGALKGIDGRIRSPVKLMIELPSSCNTPTNIQHRVKIPKKHI